MEADDYFEAYEALKQDNAPGRLTLKVSDTCGIHKIVWSSFDFMTGPELRFVWEVVPANTSLTPVHLSGDDASVIGTESMDSSMSTTSAQFEDIDDPLKSDLITAASEALENIVIDAGFDDSQCSSPLMKFKFRSGGGTYLEDYMSESRSTTTTATLGGEESRMNESRSSSDHFDDSGSTAELQSLATAAKAVAHPHPSASPIRDPMSGTPLETLNMSRILEGFDDGAGPQEQLYLPRGNSTSTTSTGSGSTVTVLTNSSSFANANESDFAQEEEMTLTEFSDAGPSTSTKEVQNRRSDELTTSVVDSGIGGTISTHSELSALCNSPAAMRRSMLLERSLLESSIFRASPPSDDDVALDMDVPLDPPDEQMNDEHFVAKFVLAEQICSTQLPSNPLLHKMTVVPGRSLLAACFMFSTNVHNDRRSMHALSILMGHKRLEWYMDRERAIENMFSDMVPKINASIHVEDNDDIIVRMTSELTRFLELFGCLERFPLVPNGMPLKIRQTLLCRGSVAEDKLLAKSISGVLQSQGYCVIVGDDRSLVSKLLFTLALFIPEEHRWCCLKEYRHKYNPYLRLQVVRRAELAVVILNGLRCEWPVCIVDADRCTVCLSSQYGRHRIMKEKLEKHVVRSILEQHSPSKTREVFKLELSPVKVLEQVRSLLKHIDLLPLEESVRMGFIEQFLLGLDNSAHAFITYVKHASEPQPGEKECGVKSKKFSLSECRRALDLDHDGLFNAVLARAELMQPQLADFLYGL